MPLYSMEICIFSADCCQDRASQGSLSIQVLKVRRQGKSKELHQRSLRTLWTLWAQKIFRLDGYDQKKEARPDGRAS